jgi:hypothetical protein
MVTVLEILAGARGCQQIEEGARVIGKAALSVVPRQLVVGLLGESVRDRDVANEAQLIAEDLVEMLQEQLIETRLGAGHVQHET